MPAGSDSVGVLILRRGAGSSHGISRHCRCSCLPLHSLWQPCLSSAARHAVAAMSLSCSQYRQCLFRWPVQRDNTTKGPSPATWIEYGSLRLAIICHLLRRVRVGGWSVICFYLPWLAVSFNNRWHKTPVALSERPSMPTQAK